MFKEILRPFVAFPICPIFYNSASGKRPVIEKNGQLFGRLGYLLCSVCTFDFQVLRASLRSFSAILTFLTGLRSLSPQTYSYLAATWLLSINLTCFYLASDEAERQAPVPLVYVSGFALGS